MGSFLITGDWQADTRNLGLIEKLMQREREVMAEYGCDARIDLGDMKNPYNPVDLKILKAMQQRMPELAVMGNHDRLSQTDTESWLPLIDPSGLQMSYALEPTVWWANAGVRFYVLPYHRDVTVLREWTAKLQTMADSHTDVEKVLLFHCGLTEADYGHGRLGLDELSVADLKLDSYDYAFGGHVHKPQTLSEMHDAYYVGSPFIQDWGEANQQKRFLIYTPGRGVKSVPVGLPGLYDWDTAKTMSPDALRGSTVRFRIPAKDTREFKALVAKRQAQFARKYPEVNLHCVPEYVENEVTDYTFIQGDDTSKVHEYVLQKFGEDKELEQTVAQALEKATSVKSVNTEGVRFIGARGHNYTSFEDVNLDYRKRGIVLVNGRNEDWPGRSNGSGKTNLQDLIKIAMFGTTGNAQETADSWRNDTLTGPAWVDLFFQNAQNQKVRVRRQRNPIMLQMWVDGVEKSSGLTGREKSNSTESLVAEHSGFDLRMLTNSVYIDQERAHRFIVGTRKEKSELLYKFLGLERFQAAREIVNKDLTLAKQRDTDARRLRDTYNTQAETMQEELPRYSQRIQIAQEQLQRIDQTINEMNLTFTVGKEALETAKAALIDVAERRKKLRGHIATMNENVGALKYKRNTLKTAAVDAECAATKAQMKANEAKRRYETALQEPVPQESTACPTCGRLMDDLESRQNVHQSRLEHLADQMNELAAAIPTLESIAAIQREYEAAKQTAIDEQNATVAKQSQDDELAGEAAAHEKVVRDFNHLSFQVQAKVKEQQLAAERVVTAESELVEFTAKKRKIVSMLEQANLTVADRSKEMSRLERAVACLDRTGIPAYLCGQLAPVLTKSADHYATLLGDNALKVVFRFDDGDFDAEVFNAQGSSERLSVGEWATASLITAFALRSVAPKTNVLILDEPGRGLDELGQHRFAEALSELRGEFDTIFITTHEKSMQTAIEADSVLTVVKKDRISSLQISSV